MIKKLWAKLKSALTFNVQQPFIFKLNLVLAMLTASTITVLPWTTVISDVVDLVIIGMIGASSVAYLLESIAFMPDRYVEMQRYKGVVAILNVAEIHRKALIDEVTKMKKSKAKTKLSNILGIQTEEN